MLKFRPLGIELITRFAKLYEVTNLYS